MNRIITFLYITWFLICIIFTVFLIAVGLYNNTKLFIILSLWMLLPSIASVSKDLNEYGFKETMKAMLTIMRHSIYVTGVFIYLLYTFTNDSFILFYIPIILIWSTCSIRLFISVMK